MNISSNFKVLNLVYWVCLVVSLGFFFQMDHWTRWLALFLAAATDTLKTKHIRAWERYNISQEKKETK